MWARKPRRRLLQYKSVQTAVREVLCPGAFVAAEVAVASLLRTRASLDVVGLFGFIYVLLECLVDLGKGEFSGLF